MNPFAATLRQHLVIAALLLAAALAVFWPTLGWMAERFTAPDSFYSHGWLIPFASAWLAWQRREMLQERDLRGSLWGFALLIPALALHTLAVAWHIGFLSGFAMVAAMWGLVWTCGGLHALRILRVPLAFLFFMVPLPGTVLLETSFRMKLVAADWAARVLHVIGIPAQQGGSIIIVPGLRVVVDDTCSGLRSLISLTALAVLWAAAVLPRSARLWQRMVLVASSIPIALVANAIRIVVLVLLGTLYGPRVAEGFVHTGSGLLLFSVALLALAGVGHLVRR